MEGAASSAIPDKFFNLTFNLDEYQSHTCPEQWNQNLLPF